MFRQIANQNGTAAQLIRAHPARLAAVLEAYWHRVNIPVGFPGQVVSPPAPDPTFPYGLESVASAAAGWQPLAPTLPPGPAVPQPPPGIGWNHLIYAYMIENTRIYEIFRRVVHELLHGEKLGAPGSAATQAWLRNTEQLFYREPPPFLTTSLSSSVRPDLRATRRNAYQRMFGMDLNHGHDDNSPYPFARADAGNNEFVTTFEELLREVWVGYSNYANASGAKPTDDAKLEELAKKIETMLITRRTSGNLSREEFFFVAMMSWFDLTVSSQLPIMNDLRAQGSTSEQRLFAIAQRVGLPAHGLSRSYFEIAQTMSSVLIAIETGQLGITGAAPTFYDPTVPNSLANDMTRIITHWSLITGRDVKARKVAST